MFKKLVDQAKSKLEEQATKIKEQALDKLNEAGEGIQGLKDKANEKISEAGDNIQGLKNKATDKLNEAGDQLKDLKSKVSDGIQEKKEDLKNMKDKALEKVTLDHLVPDVKNIIQKKVVPMLNVRTLGKSIGDDRIQAAFTTAYEFLPAPIRLVVGQETFLKFCSANKAKLLDEETEESIKAIPESTQKFSNADEIIKLKELTDQGVLTEEEFETFKLQLL